MKISLKEITIKELIVIIAVVLAIFSQPLNLTYYGEILTVISIIYILFYIISKKKLPKVIAKVLILCFTILFIGFIGNVCSDVNRDLYMILLDAFTTIKVYMCFCFTYLFFSEMKNDSKKRILKLLGILAKIITIIAILLYLINYVFDLNLSDDVRYGIPSYKFCYESSGWLNQYWIGVILILTANLIFDKTKKTNIIYIILALFIWATSLRSRAFAMIIFYIVTYIYLYYGKNTNDYKKHIFRMKNIIPVFLIMILIGYNQIVNYFFNTTKDTARSLLLENGFKVMYDYFPLGSGLGTYGTEVARVYYSPLYYRYGMNSFWALKEGGSELTDCYWPAVAAEFGFFGTITMMILLIIIFKEWVDKTKMSKFLFMTVIIEIVYIILSSTATGILFSDLTSTYMIIIGLIINCNMLDKRQ